ncbi:MAG: 2Fe-2S iron-sulfur cluster-binding protein [Candidatus Bathyarchaeota archaeon]|nr:2Fe-2S iron-sulfur cluster-binding protein [Candidatus Bathyarchaeota archaeon]
MDDEPIELIIDGIQVSAVHDATILEVAKQYGIYIPTLCDLEGLTSFSGCRLCLVEIRGSPKLYPACTTPVTSGMEIITNSEKLKEYRKICLSLLLSERTHVCSVCIANNNCELQDLSNKLGVDHVSFERNWTKHTIDSGHDFLVIDRNRCILCTRCIRVCQEIEGAHTLDLKNRGKDSQITIDFDALWGDSCSCTACRKCAKVCPTGAIYIEDELISKTKDKNVVSFLLKRRMYK